MLLLVEITGTCMFLIRLSMCKLVHSMCIFYLQHYYRMSFNNLVVDAGKMLEITQRSNYCFLMIQCCLLLILTLNLI